MFRKKRVLVEGLSNNYGGTEAVISNYVKNLSSDFVFDYIVEHPLTSHLDLLSGDNKQIVIPSRHNNPIEYYKKLHCFMRENACQYDIAWINKNNFGNVTVLSSSRKAGIPKRILHFHSLTPTSRKHYQSLVDGINQLKVKQDATDFWVCSSEVGKKYFDGLDFNVMPNAFEFEEFKFSDILREEIREANGVSWDDLLVGTIGRIEERKNQSFLLDITKNLLDRGLKVKLMIIGDGPLKNAIQSKAIDMGISDAVILIGAVPDPATFLSSFDIFAFPSLSEGLGIAAIEAQINGLPCVASNAVSKEIEISNGVTYLEVFDSEIWANAIISKTRNDFVLYDTSRKFNIDDQSKLIKDSFLL